MAVVCYKLKLSTRIAKINKSLSWRRVSMSLLIFLLFHIVASWLLRQVYDELRMNESVYWFFFIDTTITFTWPGTNAHPGGDVREFSKVKLWTMVNKYSKKYFFNLGFNLCSIFKYILNFISSRIGEFARWYMEHVSNSKLTERNFSEKLKVFKHIHTHIHIHTHTHTHAHTHTHIYTYTHTFIFFFLSFSLTFIHSFTYTYSLYT